MNRIAPAQQRNCGLDLLRCLSMFFVIVLHIFNHGGLASALETDLAGKTVSTMVQALVYPAVDCFVLLSGYLLCRRSFQVSRVIKIWTTVVFWSVVIQCVFCILKLDTISAGKTVFMFLPVLSGRYWFVNAYLVMLLVSPFLNRLLWELPQWQMRGLLLITAAVFCLSPMFALGNDVFGTQNGFGFSWFCVVYLWGGYIRQYCPQKEHGSGCYLGIYILLCAAHTAWIIGIKLLGGQIEVLAQLRNVFMKYTSVPVFGGAVCLLLYFRSIRFRSDFFAAKLCGWVSPLVFSVYLIHDHPLVREYWTRDRFAPLGELPLIFAVLCAILAAIGIFAACVGLDWIRKCLFSMMRIPTLCDRLSSWLTQKIVIRLKGDL